MIPTPNASSRPRAVTAAAFAALGALAVAAVLASPRASASQPADGLQTSVYYTWHDLSTEKGTRALYQRIVRAAEEVCPGSDSMSLTTVAASRECERAAIARAIGQIGNSRLAAIDAQAVAARRS